MLFNSLAFLVFFPLVTAVYFSLPHRWRWMWLLGASYWFYGSWRAEYLVLIWASTLVDYTAGRLLGVVNSGTRRRLILGVSLTVNLGILFTFKYLDFVATTIASALGMVGFHYDAPETKWLLPVGISFYTFQTMAYTIDVYRRRMTPESHLGRFALYVAFFPQLVAGPIERSQSLLPQLQTKRVWNGHRVESGLRLMGWGFFKKLVIADRLALLVDTVYADPSAYGGVPLTLATYAFAWQIYCDFSGYSDIAIGAARVLGINLMVNFDRPYAARSIGEFWQRWHISLSTWFRDYLYIPLGGNRVSHRRWQANLLITFIVSGLWHGASWNFVIWGGMHGMFLLFGNWMTSHHGRLREILPLPKLSRLIHLLQVIFTFHLTLLAWIFFRANSLVDAWYILTHLGQDWSLSLGYGIGVGVWATGVAILAILVMECVQFIHSRSGGIGRLLDTLPFWQRWMLYYGVLYAILMFGRFNHTEFIYFQF